MREVKVLLVVAIVISVLVSISPFITDVVTGTDKAIVGNLTGIATSDEIPINISGQYLYTVNVSGDVDDTAFLSRTVKTTLTEAGKVYIARNFGIDGCFVATGLTWTSVATDGTTVEEEGATASIVGRLVVTNVVKEIRLKTPRTGTYTYSELESANEGKAITMADALWIANNDGSPAGEPQWCIRFNTGASSNPYPSISGTHKGTITPNQTITVSKLYTYPCPGTGGHSEYVKIWNSTCSAEASWDGYKGDWHNITFPESFTLKSGEIYNYTIKSRSYPQIIHAKEFNATGGKIVCKKFVDANGKEYNNWILAIKLC